MAGEHKAKQVTDHQATILRLAQGNLEISRIHREVGPSFKRNLRTLRRMAYIQLKGERVHITESGREALRVWKTCGTASFEDPK